MFLKNRLHRLILLALLGLVSVHAAWAGTVGKISGVVSAKDTGQPLGGVNVALVGTTIGATAGSDGRYSIINVPAGTYQVQATLVGWRTVMLDQVQVAPDFTTEVNFSLEQTVLGVVPTVEIRAEKPLIQKDLTGTTRFMDRQQIEDLPARGYQQAASMQAGIVTQTINQDLSTLDLESTNTPRIHVRGGREEEVAYFVDGFSQQDPLTGISTTSISQNAVDQIVVMTGGFNAEYGKIMSGAVNVITREGTEQYTGAVELITDNLAGDWVGAKSYDYNIYDVSLGGPLIPGSDQIMIFASGERRWQRDRDPRPIDGIGLTPEQKSLFKDGRLPNNDLSGSSYQAKATWSLSKELKVRLGTIGSTDNWQEYHHQYLFDLAHSPRYEDTNKSLFGTVTHTLNPNTFYTVGMNWFYTERFRGDGRYFKDLKAYGRIRGNPTYDSSAPLFWDGPVGEGAAYTDTTAHVWDDYLHRESEYIGFKSDFSSQWNPVNQAKVGVEYRYHTLRRYRHLYPYRVDEPSQGYIDVDRFGYDPYDPEKHLDGDYVDPVTGVSYHDGAQHPQDASVYVQNKYEKDNFVLNAGLRYDYLNVNTYVMKSESDPLGANDHINPEDLKGSKTRNKVSPRLGVGFPVADRTQFHANYGIFFQQPNLQDLYTGYQYVEYKVFKGGYYYPFGNPALNPETTTAYEIGFTQQVAEQARFDATAFYKSVQDLVQVQSISASPNSYSSFRNTDYGTIKGLDFTFDLRRTGLVSGSINYTYSFANGTGSVSNTQRNIAWQTSETVQPPKQTAPLDFDQRHKLALNVDLRTEMGQGPMLGSTHPLENAGLNILVNIGSGNPYTPTRAYDEVTLASVSTTPTGAINELYGPWRYRIDMKADRSFLVGGLDLNLYVWVLNVLNRKNPVNVYTSTGDAYDTGWLSTPTGGASYGTPEEEALYQLAQRNPNNFDSPRCVRFGLRTSF
jgi:outer membrane receptor protein involved in Fe transport